VTNINAVKSSTGITATSEGNNLILKGDGVQNVNIVNNDYTVTSAAQPTLATMVTAAYARTATWTSADVQVGRTLTMYFSAGTGLTNLSSQAETFSYTVVTGDTKATVAREFYDLISAQMLLNNQGLSIDKALSISGATIAFLSLASAGSATITMGVTQLGAANKLFSANSADQYAAIKLQSTDGSPIRVNFGESGRADGELGLVEMNVGDTTYDDNDPTSSVTTTTTAAVSGISVATSEAAEAALSALDAALETVTQNRADLGAVQNRLNHTVSNLSNVVENTAASQSRILDADFAVEAAALARAQILQQAGTAMLAQANAAPQNVLSLLG